MKCLFSLLLCVITVLSISAQSGLPSNLHPSGANNIKTAPANTNIQQPLDSMVIKEFPLKIDEKKKEEEKVIIPDSLLKVAEQLAIDSNKIKRAGEIDKQIDKPTNVDTTATIPKVVNPKPTVIKTKKEGYTEATNVTMPSEPKEQVGNRNKQFANNRINAGSLRIGTTTDLNFLKLKKDTVNTRESASLDLNAEIGYFIWNNIELNVRAAFQNKMEVDIVTQELIKTEYGFGLRGYIMGKLFGGISYHWVTDEQPIFEDPLPFPTIEKIESQYLKYEVGFAGFFNHFIAFEPTLFWTDVRQTTNQSFIQDSFGFNLGLGVYFQNRK